MTVPVSTGCGVETRESSGALPTLYPELQEWIEGLQLIAGASLLLADGGGSLDDEQCVFGHLTAGLADAPSDGSFAHRKKLNTLPPAGLELLANLPDGLLRIWDDQRPVWREAFERLLWDGQRSSLGAAKLIGERLKTAKLDPAQITRLAKLELGSDWGQIADLQPRLNRLMNDLGKTIQSHQTALALCRFRQSGAIPPRWSIVENGLLQGAFSWPLLVLESDEAIACALPITIDVQLSSSVPSTDVVTGPNIVADDWQASLDKARRMALAVWSKYHGAWHLDFQRAVRRASVTLDLRLASEIAQPFITRHGRFRFHGGSLESMLALEILARFLGLPGLGTTCATGPLGRWIPNGTGQHRHRKGGDCFVEPVWDEALAKKLEQKITCAKRNFFFDQIIVPPGSVQADHRSHLRVSVAKTLSDYAKCAFGQEMRHHRYVRTPDIGYSFKKYKSLNDSSEELEEIVSIYNQINKSSSTVIRFSKVRATSVGQALCMINTEAADDDNPAFEAIDGNERQASFAFVRAAPNELNDRFWRVIWDLLGADDSSFDKFRFTRSPAEAAKLFVEQMNWLEPTIRRRVRAPDVLVIVGHQLLSRPDPYPTGPFGRLQLQSVIEQVEAAEEKSEVLVPASNPVAAHHLGRTRLILVEEEFDPPLFELQTPDPLKAAYQKLSTFRFGFTLEMARVLLGLPLAECEALLEELGRVEAFGRPLLVYAEPAGEYFLQARAGNPNDPLTAADLQMRAGNAIVGFLRRTEGAVRFDFAQALKPAPLHEAQWHVSEASRRARRAGKRSSENYQAAIDRLSRLGEPFGWSALRWAVRQSAEADFDLWAALQGHIRMRPKTDPPHPQELVLAACFAHKLERRKQSAGEPHETVAELSAAKQLYLQLAWKGCYDLPASEHAAARFLVATTKASLSMEGEPNLVGFDRAQPDIQKAFRFMRFARSIETPEWFEYVGDATTAPAVAAGLYRRGFWNTDIEGARGLRVEMLGKYLGSCELANIKPDGELLARIPVEVGPHAWNRIRRDSGLETGLHQVGQARQRWRLGKAVLLKKGSAVHASRGD